MVKTSVDTTEATTDSTGPGGAGGHSVWWTIKPAKDGPLYLSTKGSNYHVYLNQYHAASAADTPDQWTRVGGTHPSMITTVKSGGLYYVAISPHSPFKGGNAKLTVRSPAHVLFTLANNGVYDPVDGSAVIHGTVRSSKPTTVNLRASLRQLVGGHVVVGWGGMKLKANMTWSTCPRSSGSDGGSPRLRATSSWW